ncbi:hypothetical protein [Massilia rubra]|uniref:Uncharacterized protein n=1 Tax=Massilia rubra TaxID=2607910 RepID=A0ABX0LRI2_9BURK|nr:hypothetical protein [Massilia rubra]NHZ37466.1 hypothetical protein [Massilia rubra]
MNELLQELNRRGGWDWCIRSFDGDALHLSAGSSLSAVRHMVAFGGVSYLACPSVFHHPVFRLARADERLALGAVTALGEDELVVAIDADSTGGMALASYFIVATSATLDVPGAA